MCKILDHFVYYVMSPGRSWSSPNMCFGKAYTDMQNVIFYSSKKNLSIFDKYLCPFSSFTPHGITNLTDIDSFYPMFSNKLSYYPPNLTKNSVKCQPTPHIRQNSVCSKLIICPSSEILHEQRSAGS